MRKYYWDKKELLREFNMLKKLLNNSSVSDDEKKKIQTKLMMLLDMNECSKVLKRCIRNLRIFNCDVFFNIDSASNEIKNNITKLQDDIMRTHFDLFYNSNINNTYPNAYKKFLPENLKIFFEKEVFLSAKGKEEDFKRMAECKNHFLCLDKHLESGYFFPYDKKSFILSNGKNNVKSFITLSHELGHYLEFCFNDFFIKPNNKSKLYEEVSSLLLEHISLDILRKHGIIDAREKTDIQKQIMHVNTSPAEDYYLIRSIINDSGPTDIDRIRVHFYNDVVENLTYYYSYIMAVNLYYQYLEDPNMANKNLRKLLINYSDENELELLRECKIDINGNVLKKHLDKLKSSN